MPDFDFDAFNHEYNDAFPTRLNKCSVCSDRQQGVIFYRLFYMPKVKTNSSAKKRFKVTGTGEITFQKAFKRHILNQEI
jgi:hypothetical protein